MKIKRIFKEEELENVHFLQSRRDIGGEVL
jgi:hypothetical protein